MFFRRLIQLTMALLMALPVCGCCLSKALAAPKKAAKNCTACHRFLLPEDRPIEEPESGTDCPCCLDTLERTLSPETLASTQLTPPSFQPLTLWPESIETNHLRAADLARQTLRLNHPPPQSAVPRYHQFCALLI